MLEIACGRLRDDEVETVIVLAGDVWRKHYPGIITPEQVEYMFAQRYKAPLIRQLVARGDLWLAARAGEDLVGLAHGHALQDGDYKLDKLYVHNDWQRHGIGGRLIDAVAGHARAHGASRLLLRVNRQNHNAIGAYLKHGFRVATLIVEEIGNGFIMDDYVMTKEI